MASADIHQNATQVGNKQKARPEYSQQNIQPCVVAVKVSG